MGNVEKGEKIFLVDCLSQNLIVKMVYLFRIFGSMDLNPDEKKT